MDDGDLGELLSRCGLGDRAAFSQLYASTSAKLFGVALRILNNRGDAEDVLQESYVKIWHNAGRFLPGRGSVIGWMVSIVRNQSIDRLRARRAPAEDIERVPGLEDAGPTPEAQVIGASEMRRIDRCLDALPPDRSQAVRAAYLMGYSYAELARWFDVPLNTIRTRLRRALLNLRECLSR